MPSRDIKDAHPVLQEAWPKIKAAYEAACPGFTLSISCSRRSPQEQQELYAQGRTKAGQIVTQIDGKNKLGAHNFTPSRAIDVMVVKDGKAVWSDASYAILGPILEDLGDARLEWGGHWTSFKDLPHIQLRNFRNV